MTDEHEIDPGFRHSLSRELQSTLRRERRWRRGARRRGWSAGSIVRLAAAFTLALPLGAFGAYAAIRFDDRREQELLVAQLETMIELQRTRIEVQVDALNEAALLAERGLVDGRELMGRHGDLRRAEIELGRLELDLKETTVSGREPDGRITAPLVGGVDYVTERLALRLDSDRVAMESAVAGLARLEPLAEAMMVSDRELDEARQQLLEAEQATRRTERLIAIRHAFLQGDHTALEAELEAMRLEAESRRGLIRSRLELAHREAERVGRLHEQGACSDAELRAAHLRVMEAEAELRLIELELQIVETRLDTPNRDD